MISVHQELSLDEKRAQLARLLSSATLQNAPMLQKLLEFLGMRAMNDEPEDLNEWIIATTVFGRSKEFDSATDTTVRTAIYRLRSKLREYFANEGKQDPILIEIPKGHHVPVFLKREIVEDCPVVPLSEVNGPAMPEVPARPRSRTWLWSLVVLACLGFGFLSGRYAAASNASHPEANGLVGKRVAAFWRAFADGKPVIVAYSNAELLQTDTRDLIHFDKGAVDDRGSLVDPALAERSSANPGILKGHSVFYEDGYTGTGEVQAAYALTRVLTQLGIDIEVKRVRLLTSDDFKARNVVLLGSSLENRAIDDLRLRQGFVFELPLRSMWVGRILDTRGQGNDPAAYTIERDPVSQALRSDYAIVSLQPGVNASSRILVVGGLTTSGTQGAAEYITSDANLSDLSNRLHWEATSLAPLPAFESVLQVRVVRGLDPVSIRCVKARPTSGS